MPKRPISVTLDVDNLLWLKAQTASGKRRSLSDTIDALLTAARTAADGSTTSRSVVGTIDIAPDDPGLDRADAYVRNDVEASLARGVGGFESGSARRSAKPRPHARGQKARG